ncbi:MAG: hypothetical protein KGL39_29295 [Patescibacteria group bacterium]|nr:hypothetical protein [Patescibacteria group bacterium]
MSFVAGLGSGAFPSDGNPTYQTAQDLGPSGAAPAGPAMSSMGDLNGMLSSLNPSQLSGLLTSLMPYLSQNYGSQLGLQGLLNTNQTQQNIANLMGNYGLQNTEAGIIPGIMQQKNLGALYSEMSPMFAGIGNFFSGGMGGLNGGISGLPTGMSSSSGAGFSFNSPGPSQTAASQIAGASQATGAPVNPSDLMAPAGQLSDSALNYLNQTGALGGLAAQNGRSLVSFNPTHQVSGNGGLNLTQLMQGLGIG